MRHDLVHTVLGGDVWVSQEHSHVTLKSDCAMTMRSAWGWGFKFERLRFEGLGFEVLGSEVWGRVGLGLEGLGLEGLGCERIRLEE